MTIKITYLIRSAREIENPTHIFPADYNLILYPLL